MDDELINFLHARLDEDEATANAASGGEWDDVVPEQPFVVFDVKAYRARKTQTTVGAVASASRAVDRAHIVRHDPARVLVEVEAKRRMLAELLDEGHASVAPGGSTKVYCDYYGTGTCTCNRDERVERYLRLLAPPYSDHPDYREEWRP